VRWDPRLRSPTQLEQFTGVPVLASVPTYANLHDRRVARARDVMLLLVLIVIVAAYAIALALKWTSIT